MIYDEILIMESDGDSPVVSGISIGKDIHGNVIISLDTENYSGTPCPSENVMAVLDSDCIECLSRHYHIQKDEVMKRIFNEFREGGYISRTDYVRARFNDILEYILDSGGKYRLKN